MATASSAEVKAHEQTGSAIGVIDQCITGNSRNFLIWSGKTAVNDKNFSIAFYRALSFALVNRHMAVDDMAFFRIQPKFTEQIVYNFLVFQKMIVSIFLFLYAFPYL